MASCLQHTFNFPNFVHFQQLAKYNFPTEGWPAAARHVVPMGRKGCSQDCALRRWMVKCFANGEQMPHTDHRELQPQS